MQTNWMPSQRSGRELCFGEKALYPLPVAPLEGVLLPSQRCVVKADCQHCQAPNAERVPWYVGTESDGS